MAPKSENKIDDQAVFLYLCLKIAKENGGKVDGGLLGKTLNLKPGTAMKRLYRLTEAIEAQLDASDPESNGVPAEISDAAKSPVEKHANSNPASAPVKQVKKRKLAANGSSPAAESKKRKSNKEGHEMVAVKEEAQEDEDGCLANGKD